MNKTYLLGRFRRRQTAIAQRQHVITQNTPVKPAKIPTITGVQLEGIDGDLID
jgi:hypothetical protein